ncbi:MAG: hypothetical protein WCK98_05240 [bacterium]
MLPKQNKENLLKYRILFGFFTGVFAVATAASIFSLIPQNNEPVKQANASNNALNTPALTCSNANPELCYSKRTSESGGFGTVDFLFSPNQGAVAPVFSDTSAAATVTLALKNLNIPDDTTLSQTYVCSYSGVKEFATPDVAASYKNLLRRTSVINNVAYTPSEGCGSYIFTYADKLAFGGSIGLNYEFKIELRRVSDNKIFTFRDSYIYTIGGGGTAN